MNSALLTKLAYTLVSFLTLMTLIACNPQVEEGESISIDSVSPSSGALTGGRTITITGTGFKFISAIYIGDEECTDLIFLSYNKVTCTTPANSTGVYDLRIVGMGNKSAYYSSAFTYQSAPSIASVTPSSGFTSGGTTVVISGSGFISGATVRFGGALCTNTTFVDSNTITCKTPARGAGAKDVVLTNPDAQDSNTETFTFVAPPLISSISPNGGPLAGGTLVTITGSGFNAGTTISFGASSCPVQSLAGTSVITCLSPLSGAAGAVNVTALNLDSQTSSKVNGYTYRNAPTVSAVSIDSGPLAGGTVIFVTGTNFSAGATASLGGTNCTNTFVNSSTAIVCVSAARAAGLVDLVVTNSDTQSGTLPNAYTYRPAPTVTSVSPSSGPESGGTPVTITGTGFVAGATVKIGGVTCTGPTVVDANTITCTTGLATTAGASTVTVTNYDTQLGSLSSGFTYVPPPTVTSVSPSSGFVAGGTTVTITGSGFLAGATVDFDGSPCGPPVTVNSSSSITCVTSGHAAGDVDVTVTNTDLQSGTATDAFTYVPPPTVSSVSPNSGTTLGATNVTITGTGFIDGATVDFGGSSCDNVSVVAATSITCTTTAHSAGLVAVTVTNPDTQSGNANAYTYLTPAALIFNPAPADPDNWGLYGVDISKTYIIENSGGMPTSVLNSATVLDTVNWSVTTDNCAGAILNSGNTCFVDVTFNASAIDDGDYATTLNISGAGGENLNLTIEATDTSSND